MLALVIGSLAITERSLFGLAFATLVMLALIVALAFLVSLLFPVPRRYSALRLVPLFGISALLVRRLFFSQYLEGGTLIYGHTPLIREGSLQVAGYGFVLGYAFVITLAVWLIERPRPSSNWDPSPHWRTRR
ncbi:hypothetical protein [Paracoccus sp. IB05]|uniref:hypothetical protein n=1 Tax=Paracoccus sp. IB05 TaxID=2779367 RepID=UPI0018E6F699|nr:hypothetical protein [Paracoccus sp. IB05]MBJ2150890.1 hypothetical protein [Paracoccus sp. IB05]